uniref:Uncharacterized protein n=1 Tax=Nelumbo nucifera TaxID=4432 RepID=A0A822ZTW9_NELNU|nr:TPA_asm: hypothetical protein HUJ06_018340 [Nelumbo nucifera]
MNIAIQSKHPAPPKNRTMIEHLSQFSLENKSLFSIHQKKKKTNRCSLFPFSILYVSAVPIYVSFPSFYHNKFSLIFD